MEVNNNLSPQVIESTPKKVVESQKDGTKTITANNELIGSEASFAARAYASPQVNFGKNISDFVYSELKSNKNPSQIKLTFNEVKTFLENKLKFTFSGFRGSHAKFSKAGLDPLVIAVHGNKEVNPAVIKDLRNHLKFSPEFATS